LVSKKVGIEAVPPLKASPHGPYQAFCESVVLMVPAGAMIGLLFAMYLRVVEVTNHEVSLHLFAGRRRRYGEAVGIAIAGSGTRARIDGRPDGREGRNEPMLPGGGGAVGVAVGLGCGVKTVEPSLQAASAATAAASATKR